MRAASGFSLVLASCVLFGCATTALESARGRWHEVRTDRFEVLTEADPEQARALVQDLERFHQVMLAKTTAQPREGVPPLRIFVTRGRASFEALTQRERTVAGVFTATVRGNYAVVQSQGGEPEPQTQSTRNILFHEYVHYMMAASGARVPSWYNEGFAEYMATTVFRSEGDYTVGCPPQYRTRWFEQASWMPMARLLASDDIASLGGDSHDTYMQAWYAVHYLSSDTARKRQLSEYLTLSHQVPWEAAVKQAFDMDADAFDRVVHAHAEVGEFECAAITPATPLDVPAVQVRPVSAAVAHLELGDLVLSTLGPTDPTMELLEHAVKVTRGDPVAEVNLLRGELAREGEQAGDAPIPRPVLDAALSRAQAAAAGGHGLPEVNTLLGDLRSARAHRMKAGGEAGVAEELKLARKAYRRAIRKDASFAAAYYGLGRTYLLADSGSKEPLVVLEAAGYLVPSAIQVPLTLAALLIERGENAAAEAPLRYVLQWAKDPKLRAAAERQLQKLGEGDADEPG